MFILVMINWYLAFRINNQFICDCLVNYKRKILQLFAFVYDIVCKIFQGEYWNSAENIIFDRGEVNVRFFILFLYICVYIYI